MNFPLSFSDISLWLAATATILLITSELLTLLLEYSAQVMINKSNLRLAALGCGLAFLSTVVIRAIQQILL